MPVVGVKKEELFAYLNKRYTDEEFADLCFEFGIELDDITSEFQLKQKEQRHLVANEQNAGDEEIIYKIDVPANRYDLLCLEGIGRALKIFLKQQQPPVYTVKQLNPAQIQTITVKTSQTKQVRPYVVSAILRGISFDQAKYNSFIDLQDKLHQNICRRRTLVAIGTHDLDTIQGPFTYEALPPKDINFIPLSQKKSFNAKELLDFYRTNAECKHLKPYTDIIYDKPVYPVIYDKNRVVLSMPPIINGEHSKITMSTKNVFIECTATDLTKAQIVLNTMLTMFSEYVTPDAFTIEPVRVVYETEGLDSLKEISAGQNSLIYPVLSNRQVTTKINDIQSMLFGNEKVPDDCNVERIVELCSKMQLAATYDGPEKHSVTVQVPPTRSDILHPVDIVEDVGIAYGFNNIPWTIPTSVTTFGKPQPLNKLGDSLRDEISRAGYIELLTHGLCSHKENFAHLNRTEDVPSAVVLSNPATIEFEVVRTTMIPGVLKTIQNNKSMSMKDGLKLFEISDVVLLDKESDVGAKNVRRLCAGYTGYTDGFEKIHGLVDRVMQLVGIPPVLPNEKPPQSISTYYTIVPDIVEASAGLRTYFPGRSATIKLVKNEHESIILGSFGVLDPSVLANYELLYPVSLVEMDIEPLV